MLGRFAAGARFSWREGHNSAFFPLPLSADACPAVPSSDLEPTSTSARAGWAGRHRSRFHPPSPPNSSPSHSSCPSPPPHSPPALPPLPQHRPRGCQDHWLLLPSGFSLLLSLTPSVAPYFVKALLYFLSPLLLLLSGSPPSPASLGPPHQRLWWMLVSPKQHAASGNTVPS